MSIHITGRLMTSDMTGETAQWRPDPGTEDRGAWVVSWLPSRRFDRNGAITAMVLAATLSDPAVRPGHQLWPHVESWSRELCMTADDVVRALRRGEDRR